ncbi:hypothetical protein FA15DRAFT_633874 [Coprinopsis marcescibilis]|uniref:Uncharacterized protein n=1 Tax=Coprinopsis marcescibilis TaxID=230819 RepID=A0A5C3L756_COPMA|nr:hypothetical protein FA15DRAFT_633874 [Coprinopsis marcescibilis]
MRKKANDDGDDGCRLAEIVQYICGELEPGRSGKPRLECTPIPRIFRICRNKPAIEVTRIVNLDPKTGEVEFPPSVDSICGKDWSRIVKYTRPTE